MITRRDALKGLGALVGAAAAPDLLAACTNTESGGGTPDLMQPRGITTIVTVCMENRSYDHYLGARSLVEKRPGDGLMAGMQVPDADGKMTPIHRGDVACVADPPHGWDPSHTQWNAGKNDGFMRAYQASQGRQVPPHVMGWLGREELPVTWALADAYTSFDRWFASVMGPTWPNRHYLHSAQSGGLKSNKFAEGRLFFEWKTIYHHLSEANIPWRYYYSDLPFLALYKDVDPQRKGVHPIADFFADAAAGTLPPVVSIDPGFTLNDDHPPHHPLYGQQFIASIYAALAASPQWVNVLLVVTYDEHGGFFDHVSPPKTDDDFAADGFDQLGFRVPAIIAGPYVKPGYVSSTIHDHTSVIKHIGGMFKLTPLTKRDAAANDLSDAIDMDRLARNDPAPPIKLPAVMIDPMMISPDCKEGESGLARAPSDPTDIEQLADRGGIDPALDLRGRRMETLELIARELERHGAGGFLRR